MTRKNTDHLLSRRETLRLLGAIGATALVGGGNELKTFPGSRGMSGAVAAAELPGGLQAALFAPTPLRMTRAVETLACVARPALTEGPYFVDELLNRSDIRPDPSNNTVKAGVPLKLRINVNRTSGADCSPLPGALVDIWHCDAAGAYSDIAGGAGQANTSGQKFLRGYQVTDSSGSVEFTTVYPGYYPGRTVHIHFKIRLFAGTTRTYEFTSQLFFDDALTDQVFTQSPYNTRGARNTRNSNDGIYNSGGSQLLLDLTPDGAGYAASFDIGLSGVPNTVATVSTVSAASYAQSGMAGESIAALFGTGLATSTQLASVLPLPSTLGGVQVMVRDAIGTARAAPLFFVSPTQINFQIPPGTSAGNATLSVLRDNTAVGQGAAIIETVAPGLFAANASGQGVAAAYALRQKADGSQTIEPVAQFNQATNRFDPVPLDLGAASDQLFLIGFGTGLRNRSSLSAVAATIGGTNAEVLFAGAQTSFAGLDQVNILIPRALAGRGNTDVILRVDGKTANTVSVNIG